MVATEKYYDPDWRDRLFSLWHGVDVEGIMTQDAFGPSDPSALARATFYQPIPVRYLARILAFSCKSEPRPRQFVDIGCGKGKACLYMARTGAFERVIGVEFVPRLATVARTNFHRIDAPRAEIVEADARGFVLPPEPCLVFLFNPFDDRALETFIETNLAHFHNHRSLIAYAFDVRRETLRFYGFQERFRAPKTKLSFHQMGPHRGKFA